MRSRRWIVPTTAAAIALTAGLVFHTRLVAWFGGEAAAGGAGAEVSLKVGELTVTASLDPTRRARRAPCSCASPTPPARPSPAR